METFPELFTPRLKLRKLTVDDVDALVRYANNKKISDYVLNIPHPYQEPDAVMRISYVHQGFKAGTRYVFAIILKEKNELIGEVGLHLDNRDKLAQLGYWIGEPFWGRGLATEAVAAAIKFAFEKLGLNLVFATCHVDNPASGKVLLNNGMIEKSMNGNVIQYAMERQEYELQRATAL